MGRERKASGREKDREGEGGTDRRETRDSPKWSRGIRLSSAFGVVPRKALVRQRTLDLGYRAAFVVKSSIARLISRLHARFRLCVTSCRWKDSTRCAPTSPFAFTFVEPGTRRIRGILLLAEKSSSALEFI